MPYVNTSHVITPALSEDTPHVTSDIAVGCYGAQIWIPTLVTAISFVICTVTLTLQPGVLAASRAGNHRASTTITLYTAFFLLCNVPFIIIYGLNFIINADDTPDYFPSLPSSVVLDWYGWLLTKIVCVVLNAAFNPVLYYCRMVEFKAWISTIVAHWKTRIGHQDG